MLSLNDDYLRKLWEKGLTEEEPWPAATNPNTPKSRSVKPNTLRKVMRSVEYLNRAPARKGGKKGGTASAARSAASKSASGRKAGRIRQRNQKSAA
jgi:hypothetical protein